MSSNSSVPMKILISNDIIILIINIAILIFSLVLTFKEYSYRKTLDLFLFQLIESGIIFLLNVLMFVLNLVSKYKGHNNHGMFLRFILFYLIISCVALTYQRGENTNLEDIQKFSSIVLYIGLINNALIISSMILGFKVSDKKVYHKGKDEEEKVFNINTDGDMEIFERDKSSGSMQELYKK